MAGFVSKSIVRKKARIEIIPLIDVIFFLLATFVLFTLSLTKLQSVDINLPYSVVSRNPNPPEVINLQVSDANTLYWNREPITMVELAPRLASYKQTHPNNTRIMVTSDDKALFGQAIAVFDLIRKLGIDQVSIDTSRWHPTGQ